MKFLFLITCCYQQEAIARSSQFWPQKSKRVENFKPVTSSAGLEPPEPPALAPSLFCFNYPKRSMEDPRATSFGPAADSTSHFITPGVNDSFNCQERVPNRDQYHGLLQSKYKRPVGFRKQSFKVGCVTKW